MEETIVWNNAEDGSPDEGLTVLVACGHPANESLDVYEAALEDGFWRSPDGCQCQHVRYWAEMPAGPKVTV